MLILIWLMMVVAYFDRIVIAVAGPAIRADLGISKSAFGFVLSAFTVGYALMQAPGGHLADRFGSRRILVIALLVWSAFTGLTGFASSLAVLLAVRLLFGIGEGIENAAQFKLIGDHFSSRERSMASAVFLTSIALGPALTTPAASWLLGAVGWRVTFYWFCVPGLLVALLIHRFLPQKSNGKVSDAQASTVEPGEAQAETSAGSGIRAPVATYLLFNIAFWGFLGWIPTYLREQKHLDTSAIGFLGAMPYVCGLAGVVLFGFLGSKFESRRALLVCLCCLGAAISLYLSLTAATTGRCITGLSASGFFLYGVFGPFWAVAIDRAAPERRGVTTGLVGFGGQMGGFIGQIAVGLLADRMHSFNGAIMFMSGALAVGAAAACAL